MTKLLRSEKSLMFKSDFGEMKFVLKSITKTLYRNKFLVSKYIFKLVCHYVRESCKLSEIDCA